MGFLIDILLLGLLAAVVAIYARRSVFAAGFGALVAAISVVTALFVTPLLAPMAQTLVRPSVEKSVAASLADMHSAPHAATPEQTVASLPLGDLIAEKPEGYLHLLEEYGVAAETVEAAFLASPQPMTVVHTVAEGVAAAITETLVFLVLAVAVAVLLRFIVRRIEQNLPPLRRYRGFKLVLPALFGVLAGLIWSFAVVLLLSRLVPAVAGKAVMFTPTTLKNADWYSLLERINPLPLLQRLVHK